MAQKYLLIVDSHAEEVERLIGLRGYNTPLGVFVEKPEPFDLTEELALFDKALHPNRCICGRGAILHHPKCPAWNVIT